MKFPKSKIIVALAVALGGCASNTHQEVTKEINTVATGPESAPMKNITKMSDSLRCMDRLFLENGIRDLVVLTEDINDNTKKLQMGSRDMLISAVSEMTRRSRAVRLITFGGDVSNLVNWLNASGANKNVYTFKPDFDIRGSISQMDDNLVQKREGGGVTLGPINLDKSRDGSAAILGLDMSIISTQTMEVLPGVVSRNSISVVKEGQGVGAGVSGTISKKDFGINYDFSFNKNEGTSQAVRTLIELASIELFGKLARVPYWSCLGIDAEQALVKDEISDWYAALDAEQKLIPYIQNQLRIRGVYRGPISKDLTPELNRAVAVARQGLELRAGGIDEELFTGLVNLKSKTLGAPSDPVAHLTVAQLDKKSVNRLKGKKTRSRSIGGETDQEAVIEFNLSKPKSISITAAPVKPGDSVTFNVKTPENTFAYCYYKEGADNWMRVFPNRFQSDPFVSSSKGLAFPGDMKVDIKVGSKQQKESVTCFNTTADIRMGLSPDVFTPDLETASGLSLESLRAGFSKVAANNLSEATFELVKR